MSEYSGAASALNDLIREANTSTEKKLTAMTSVRGTVTLVGDEKVSVDVGGGHVIPCTPTVKCHVGDRVVVETLENTATVTHNLSAQAATDEEVVEALNRAEQAAEAADEAVSSAQDALDAAGEAQAAASAASTAAGQASADAQQASADAQAAQLDASTASSMAESARDSADRALFGLSDIEKVVGTVSWIAEHGYYAPTQDTSVVNGKVYYREVYSYSITTDTEVDPNKTYYEHSGEVGEYVYAEVENPVDEDIATYYERSTSYARVDDPQDSEIASYFELAIDQSVQNYIASHLAQTDYGLDLMADGSSLRAHLGTVDGNSAMGLYILDGSSVPVARFNADGAVIGKATGAMHVELTSNRLAFVDANGNEAAYIETGETGFSVMYITRSVVVEDMQFGNWKWYSRANGNMALRWMGVDV